MTENQYRGLVEVLSIEVDYSTEKNWCRSAHVVEMTRPLTATEAAEAVTAAEAKIAEILARDPAPSEKP